MTLRRLAAATLCAASLSSCSLLKPTSKDDLVTLTTPQGEIKLVLFDETPKHKANFLKLAKSGYYDGTTFHRVINQFMIQGGDPNSKDADPNNDGQGGPGYTIPAEIESQFKHVRGAVAAARQGDQMNPKRESSGSQFYLVQNSQGTPFLDGQYTVFGMTVAGLDAVDKIAQVPKNPGDRPKEPVKMTVKVERLSRKKITEMTGYQFDGKPVAAPGPMKGKPIKKA